MLDEIMLMGVCAFCKHGTHDFPSDPKHKKLHDLEGWHSCEVDGCFRFSKPLCENMVLKSSAVVGWV